MRGISTIVEMLLVLVLLITLVSLLWLFTSGTINAITKAGTQSTQRTQEILSTCMIVDSVHGNNIYIRNCGNGVITNDSLNVYLDEVPIESSLAPKTIGKGETGTITANLWGLSKGDHYIKITNPSSESVQEVEASLPDSCVLASDLNEGSGGTVNDYSGNANTGTVYARHENLINYSQDYSNGVWDGYCGSKTNIVYNAADVMAPDGTQTATKWITTAGFACDGTHTESWGVLQPASPPIANGVYTVSVWLRGVNDGEQVKVGINDITETIFTLTKDWVRYSYRGLITFPSDRRLQFFSITPSATYYAWGAQLEKESSASLYSVTTSTTFNDGTIAYAGQFTPWTLGKFGDGLLFDGVDEYVITGSSSSLNAYNGGLGVSFWIKPNSLGTDAYGNQILMFMDGCISNGYGITLEQDGSVTVLSGAGGTNVGDWSFNPSISIGNWYYLVFTWSSTGPSTSTQSFYVNGQNVANRNLNSIGIPSSIASSFNIGYFNQCWPARYFNGTIDSVRVFNKALNPSDTLILKMK